MEKNEAEIDWSKTTYEGARREQLKQARTLTVCQRLDALGELMEVANYLQAPKYASMERAETDCALAEIREADDDS